MLNQYNSVLVTLKDLVEGTQNIEKDIKFNIPIYQRLYVWKEDQIKRLLEDTHTAFTNYSNNDYYLGGVIVVKNTNKYDLIDGQQRFTTLWLISRYLQNSLKPFLLERMHFSIRDDANKFFQTLDSKIENDELLNIKNAITIIENFFNENDVDNQKFSEYLYTQLKLVFTTVPPDVDLNKLFETINSGGVQLQHHELLKAKMLENISDIKEREIYSKLWDSCSFMDNYIENNLAVALNCTKTDIFQNLYNIDNKKLENFSDINRVKDFINIRIKNDSTSKKLLQTILTDTKQEPNEKIGNQEDEIKARSIISFSMFLLHTLRIFFKQNGQKDLKAIDEKELIKSFTYKENTNEEARYGQFDFGEETVKRFIDLLWQVRVIFDKHIIKWVSIEDNQDEVHLICNIRENTSNNSPSLQRENTEKEKAFSLLQSMLYHTQEVKTHYWLTPLLFKILDNEESLTSYLQQMDNYLFFPKKEGDLKTNTWEILEDNKKLNEVYQCENIINQFDLINGKDYRQFSHYLFYKIEYILWILGTKDNNFYMRAKNSVEHIEPQTKDDEKKQNIDWNDELLHSFGNLALVSRERNSEFGNLTFKEKSERFKAFKDSNQHLNMSLIYANEIWTNKTCIAHLKNIKNKVKEYMQCSDKEKSYVSK